MPKAEKGSRGMRICKGTKKKPNIQIPNPHHNEENLLHNIANMLKFADRKSISAICDYRMVGLADCNNFFVSCERTLDPSLEGRPVVVLSNNDGCAIARSNEAKRLGVKMGQPAFELRDLIESGKLIALSGNHILYRDISRKVHRLFRRFVPSAIDYSVDESFLDFSGIPAGNLRQIAEEITEACRKELGIPVTIGIAATKTLAKVATHICKKRNRRTGILTDHKEIMDEMEKLPIGELWGIGRRLSKRLMAKGVYTAADFYRLPLIRVRGSLGVNGERSWRELHGTPCIELKHTERDLQDSISETRTFPKDIEDYDYIRTRIVIYATDCARRLRAMQGQCAAITVFLRSNRFHTENGYHRSEATVSFTSPQTDTSALAEAATQCLNRIFSPGVGYKRAGVVLSRITRTGASTPSLFDEAYADTRDTSQLLAAIDRINRNPGMPGLKLASQMTAGHPWQNDGYTSSFHAPDKELAN